MSQTGREHERTSRRAENINTYTTEGPNIFHCNKRSTHSHSHVHAQTSVRSFPSHSLLLRAWVICICWCILIFLWLIIYLSVIDWLHKRTLTQISTIPDAFNHRSGEIRARQILLHSLTHSFDPVATFVRRS